MAVPQQLNSQSSTCIERPEIPSARATSTKAELTAGVHAAAQIELHHARVCTLCYVAAAADGMVVPVSQLSQAMRQHRREISGLDSATRLRSSLQKLQEEADAASVDRVSGVMPCASAEATMICVPLCTNQVSFASWLP